MIFNPNRENKLIKRGPWRDDNGVWNVVVYRADDDEPVSDVHQRAQDAFSWDLALDNESWPRPDVVLWDIPEQRVYHYKVATNNDVPALIAPPEPSKGDLVLA